jgi:hypothetical protein
MYQTFIKKNRTSGPAFLQTSHYIINVLTGIFSGLLNRTIDSDIKVLNHVLLTLANDHDKQKSKTCI